MNTHSLTWIFASNIEIIHVIYHLADMEINFDDKILAIYIEFRSWMFKLLR